jgi:ABC-type sulfate/molybdate transport systems ATPase subunit
VDILSVELTVPLRSYALELTLDVGQATVALVGPSGAGKSTVLRAIAGLAHPADGTIALGDEVWYSRERQIDLPPEDRPVGLVFQEYALFPHMTVRRNVSYGGKERVDELLERLRIAELANAKPGGLSGGERQRVALARALARGPRVLLLDEPLSALDAHTKATVRAELRELLRELELPTLLVTHDFEDAAVLADRVGVIVDGRLVQLDTPARLVASPANPFVAHLTGANLLEGSARKFGDLTEVVLGDGTTLYSTDAEEGPVGVVIYPWEITISRSTPADSSLNHVTGAVTSLVTVDNRVRAQVGQLTAETSTESAERLELSEGTLVVASFKATATRLLPLAETT